MGYGREPTVSNGSAAMSLRLTLLAHAATAATRAAAFPADEPIEPRGAARAAALAGTFGRADVAWCAPALRARQTAEALGLAAIPEPALVDLDLGCWAGRSLADIAAADPGGLARWTADPASAPHGGESVADLVERVAAWLAGLQHHRGHAMAVTHAAIVRAAVIVALDAGPAAFWRIDVEPLGAARLQLHAGRLTLRALGPLPRGRAPCPP